MEEMKKIEDLTTAVLSGDSNPMEYANGYKVLFNGITDTISALENQIEKLKLCHVLAEEMFIAN